jgi:DNA-binding transcriptional LysR family regulator
MWGLEALRTKEDVTFAQLRTFARAAQTGSFVQAADELNISQAAVSEQIKTLEERLGRSLFRRRRGTTSVLTEDGEEVLEIVETILAAAQGLFLQNTRAAENITVRISAGPFLIEKYLRPIIPRIYQLYPNVDIELHPTLSPKEVAQRIENGMIDLAFSVVPFDEEVPAYAHSSWELQMVLVARAGTKAKLAAGEVSLDDCQFIFPARKELGARWARKCLRDLGISSRSPPLFTEFIDVIAQMVKRGSGIGYVTKYPIVGSIEAGDLELLDIPLPPVRRIVARSPHSPDLVRVIEETICDALVTPQAE